MRYRCLLASSLIALCCACGDDESDGGGATVDADGDGFTSQASGGDDCDDTDAAINPNADELCDDVDNDCDGDVDEDDASDATTWYEDTDGDGSGDASSSAEACAAPEGFVADSSDCDDTDAALNQDDDDRDGSSTCDEDCDDSDGSLNPDDSDGDGYSTCDDDCDDDDDWRHPGGFDFALIDGDCDGVAQAGMVSTGAEHFCGVDDGTVRCYGRDLSTQVSGAPTESDFVQVSSGGVVAGTSHSCALDNTGALTCWGADAPQVNDVPTTGSFVQVVAGNAHSCALADDGSVSCWGDDTDGQSNPPEDITFVSLAAGGEHSCGVDENRVVHCWGKDTAGQVSDAQDQTGAKVVCGASHTCALSDGTVQCWGDDADNQLTDVPAADGFTDLAAGGDHSCALATDGSVSCWGANGDDQATPPSGVVFKALTANAGNSCGVDDSGYVQCWGDNEYGQAPVCLGSLWPVLDVPASLSEAGLYSDVSAKTLNTFIGSFEPQYKLWSDGSEKERWVYLPECATIDNSDPDVWVLPVGTRFFKEFKVDSGRVETRMIHISHPDPLDADDDGALYAAYLWDMLEATAPLWDPVDGLADAATYASADPTFTHDVPSRSQCRQCHGGTRSGGTPSRALGFSQVQLSWGGSAIGMESLSQDGRLTVPDEDGFTTPGDAVAVAALGSLHANCGNCHNALGEGVNTGDVDLDLWLSANDSSVNATGAFLTAVNVAPEFFSGPTNRITPGDPADSAVYVRMESRPDPPAVAYPQMPPLGTKIVDPDGLPAVEAWINAL